MSTPHTLDSTEAQRIVLNHFVNGDDASALALEPDDFPDFIYRTLFEAARDAFAERGSCDFLLICEKLESQRRLLDIGGAAFVASLLTEIPLAPMSTAVSILKRRRAEREAVGHARIVEAMASEGKADDIPGYLLSASEHVGNHLPRLDSPLDQLAAEIGSPGATVPTGFSEWDHVLKGGLRQGTLTLLAARPGFGKTTLALNVATCVIRSGGRVLFLSLEMSAPEIWTRILGHWHRKTEEEVRADAAALLATATASGQLVVSHNHQLSRLSSEIVGGAWDLVVLDYVQLVETSEYDGEVERISAVSRALKQLALSRKIPILALSQLSRESVRDKVPREPQLHDLRGSGSLEQDADSVCFLHSPAETVGFGDGQSVTRVAQALTGSAERDVQLLVKKNRNGGLGNLSLSFDPPLFTFSEPSPSYRVVQGAIPDRPSSGLPV